MTTPGHDNQPLIEVEQIDGLIEAAGADAARDILDAFWRSSDDLIAALRHQLGLMAIADAARTAHALKGSAANVGAYRLSRSAKSLEDNCKAGVPALAIKELEAVTLIYAQTRVALSEHLRRCA